MALLNVPAFLEEEIWASILVGAGSWNVSTTASAVSRYFHEVLWKPERLGTILVARSGSEEEALYRCCNKAECVRISSSVVRWLLKRIDWIGSNVETIRSKTTALNLACVSGNAVLAEVILDTIDTGCRYEEYRQRFLDDGLEAAATHGRDEIVASLLARGARADNRSSRALMNAVMFRQHGTVEALLSRATPSNSRPARADGAGILLAAIANNNVQAAKLLLCQELHPAVPVDSPVCLTMAVLKGDPQMVLALLTAPVGPANPDDLAAFTQAVFCGFTSIVKVLLEHGPRESMLLHTKNVMSQSFMAQQDASDEMHACLESFVNA